MSHDLLLWIAVLAFALAGLLRLLICLNAIDLKKPVDGFFVALGLAFFAGAFLVT